MADVLQVHDLSVDYQLATGAVHAARNVSFTIAAGERVGFVGESGSGKTTVALALLGMLRHPGRVVGGSAQLEGTELIGLPRAAHAQLRLSRIAYVPQGAMNSLNPVQTVRRSIADGLADHGQPLAGTTLTERVALLLQQVGLTPEVADRFPHELSGGMKQRVCIAIAISLSPRLILADEPTSALDVVTQRQVMETFGDIRARLGSALMLIGHDFGLMAQTVDRLVVMKDGRIVETGEVRDVLRRPEHPYTRDLIASVPTLGERRSGGTLASTDERSPVIHLAGAGRTYGAGLRRPGVMALRPLDLALGGEPRILSVVGQSGSGKTTLGDIVLGFVDPTAGAALYRGQPIASLRGAARQAYRRDVQAVFQDPYSAFNPFYRVDRALAQPLLKLGIVRTRSEATARMQAACAEVGLDPDRVLGRFAHQLSGGQRQRLMVARALMLRPRVLVADEPVSMVDASLRFAILDALRTLRDRHDVTVLYVTHDLATAYRVSDHVMVLHSGAVVEEGTAEAVLREPAHAYTQLLVDSIPWPDPDRAWGGSALRSDNGSSPQTKTGR